MMAGRYLRRFNGNDRIFHLFLMISFLVQTVTGFVRLFGMTPWGEKLVPLLGGYEVLLRIHQVTGILMTIGFFLHAAILIRKIDLRRINDSIFGPDSMVPNMKDARDMWQNTLYIVGMGKQPRFERWTYWEKFDYWAVFWGMPLLSITGFMLIFPMITSRFIAGWWLNIAAYLHRAEAVLAVSYIFIVHFFINHLKPTSFPMSETMFSGNISLEDLMNEKSEWAARLEKEGQLKNRIVDPPKFWFRAIYYAYGLTAVGVGIYMLVNGIYYSRYINLH